ncbi:class I SAM-dependent methyltransferase [Paenibacillus selenitireducens]|nr:class I SAM-dependent methyltransferase [Paenibacillus selenitireducens]
MSQLEAYEQLGIAMTCRSYEEYLRMFALTEDDLSKGSTLDVAGGGSSFTAEADARGYTAIAADPLFSKDTDFLTQHVYDEIELSTGKITKLQENYDWSFYGSPDLHRVRRLRSAEQFIQHYKTSPASYVGAQLPELPFANDTFHHVLCSHFLFLYADQFDHAFHLHAVRELIRVCKVGGRVLIYPLKSLRWVPYPTLDELLQHITEEGHRVSFRLSQLPFIPGSFEMLCIEKMD